MTNDPKHRGYTIFCDDIRYELGGKTTLVGVYDAVMYVHAGFPAIIPKLGFAIKYQELRGACTEEEVTMQIFLPGDADDQPTFSGQLADVIDLRKNLKMHPSARSDLTRYLQISTHLVASPLEITRPGEILIRAICGSDIVKLGSLLIIPPDEAKNPTASEQPS